MPNKKIKHLKKLAIGISGLAVAIIAIFHAPQEEKWFRNLGEDLFEVNTTTNSADTNYLSLIPEYSECPYVEINNNKPDFDASLLTIDSYETYSELDSLGRCGSAIANLSKDMMPTEERGSIGMIEPSGWHTIRYDDLIEDKYLYNRCHLIAYQLTGQNANALNLITGTRYLNIDGMLPFENEVATYIRKTNHHVLFRVTPIFEGDNLLASGVQLEAQSIEDDSLSFNVYCYNVQPGIEIDYATGDSKAAE